MPSLNCQLSQEEDEEEDEEEIIIEEGEEEEPAEDDPEQEDRRQVWNAHGSVNSFRICSPLQAKASQTHLWFGWGEGWRPRADQKRKGGGMEHSGWRGVGNSGDGVREGAKLRHRPEGKGGDGITGSGRTN